MNRKRFNLSINLSTEDGRRANEILNNQSSKSDYVIRAIIAFNNYEYLTKDNLREILKEILGNQNFIQVKEQFEDNDLDDDMLDLFTQ